MDAWYRDQRTTSDACSFLPLYLKVSPAFHSAYPRLAGPELLGVLSPHPVSVGSLELQVCLPVPTFSWLLEIWAQGFNYTWVMDSLSTQPSPQSTSAFWRTFFSWSLPFLSSPWAYLSQSISFLSCSLLLFYCIPSNSVFKQCFRGHKMWLFPIGNMLQWLLKVFLLWNILSPLTKHPPVLLSPQLEDPPAYFLLPLCTQSFWDSCLWQGSCDFSQSLSLVNLKQGLLQHWCVARHQDGSGAMCRYDSVHCCTLYFVDGSYMMHIAHFIENPQSSEWVALGWQVFEAYLKILIKKNLGVRTLLILVQRVF